MLVAFAIASLFILAGLTVAFIGTGILEVFKQHPDRAITAACLASAAIWFQVVIIVIWVLVSMGSHTNGFCL